MGSEKVAAHRRSGNPHDGLALHQSRRLISERWAFGESNWQLNRGSWTPGPLLNAFPDLVVFNPAQRTILAVANHWRRLRARRQRSCGLAEACPIRPCREIKLDERSLFATNGDWVYLQSRAEEATFRNEVWKERETAVSSLAAADFDESGQNGWGFQKYGGPARLVNGEWQPAQPLKTAGSAALRADRGEQDR